MSPEPQSPGSDPTLQDVPDGWLDALSRAARLAALGELTAGTVHAANNALFAVVAHVELLRAGDGLDGEAAERLALVEHAARDLAETMRRLGELARGDGGGDSARLDSATRDALELLRRVGQLREVEGHLPEEPVVVAGAAGDVGQIVWHVLLAAVGLAGPGGTVTADVAREQEVAVLRVRGEGTPSPPRDGGVGLAVARALARRAGGSIAAEPGGALRLELPRA
jgi:signal transduction histidine kinase